MAAVKASTKSSPGKTAANSSPAKDERDSKPKSFQKKNKKNATSEKNTISVVQSAGQSSKSPTDEKFCFKCSSKGNFHRNCPKKEKFTFCYSCGLRGVKVPECPNCNPQSGNEKGDQL